MVKKDYIRLWMYAFMANNRKEYSSGIIKQFMSFTNNTSTSLYTDNNWYGEFVCKIFNIVVSTTGPSLWSSGQSSWLQIKRSGFDSWRYQIF
jgi:hypothetical protein